jgi:hypothetical protein
MICPHPGLKGQLLHGYHAVFGHRHNLFAILVALAIALVAACAVPYMIRLGRGLASYDPWFYEPKDLDRAEQIDRGR